ncbi:MAG: hypothetical protein FWD69_15275 [Polyangiaceae bacterium]|nr:hypothetical protein [Polyangiaceae bacterium]
MTTTIRGITALARELGAYPKSIQAAINRCELSPIGVERGKPIFDLETCRDRWAASADYRMMQARGGGRPLACPSRAAESDEVDEDRAPFNPHDALLRVKVAQAELALKRSKRDYELEEEITIARDEVIKAGVELGIFLNSEIEKFVPRVSPQLLNVASEREVQEVLIREFDAWREGIHEILGAFE